MEPGRDPLPRTIGIHDPRETAILAVIAGYIFAELYAPHT
jgi:hypothetical protein